MPRTSRSRYLHLGGVAEVAQYLFITKSALADRRRQPDFPQPLADLACGPIWDMDEIGEYDLNRKPRTPSRA